MARITGSMTVDELFVELARLGVHSIAFSNVTAVPGISRRYSVHVGHMSGDGFASGASNASVVAALVHVQNEIEKQIAADVVGATPEEAIP